ncbi:ER lumen protein-retaining receptor 3 isoform X3 [Acinonyx jubatus]|uniref:ER lumen protein-retaining receptor 3 isoform X3 n=1 Tax=Acinonyx jubatus TaxID=32536 RepID=A0ABM3QFT3_ACIJB|nr:ER lumen protein-retaining receptor 3 isoform X3 [Acinonyx jubatus]
MRGPPAAGGARWPAQGHVREAPGPRRWDGREAGSRAAALPGSPGTAAGLATSPPGRGCAGGAAAAPAGSAGLGARDPEPGPGTWQPPLPPESFPGVGRARCGGGGGGRPPARGTMNVFRILGDLSHLLAMILLLGKIWRSKCCSGEGRPGGGISGKSQILFALVFTTRYLDLFTNFISVYNTVMKSASGGGGTESRRHRTRSRRQAPSRQHRARRGAGTHGP